MPGVKRGPLRLGFTSVSLADLDSSRWPLVIWLAACIGKMKQILRRDWLAAWSRWNYLARSGLSVTRAPLLAVNPYNKSFVRTRWRDISVVLFFHFIFIYLFFFFLLFMDLAFGLVYFWRV